jgi:F-type H+-transporting ATPase subunit beta
MKGHIAQVMGPVVDVRFEDTVLPRIADALTVMNHGVKAVMEVRQHIASDTVRCIMLSPSEGLFKDMEVEATGAPITIPVGDHNLGRLFDVTGSFV